MPLQQAQVGIKPYFQRTRFEMALGCLLALGVIYAMWLDGHFATDTLEWQWFYPLPAPLVPWVFAFTLVWIILDLIGAIIGQPTSSLVFTLAWLSLDLLGALLDEPISSFLYIIYFILYTLARRIWRIAKSAPADWAPLWQQLINQIFNFGSLFVSTLPYYKGLGLR